MIKKSKPGLTRAFISHEQWFVEPGNVAGGQFSEKARAQPDAPWVIKLPAITPTTPAPAIATKPRPSLLGPGLIDGDIAAVKLSAVQSLDRFLSLRPGTHLDKAKSLGPTRKFVHDYPSGLDGSVRSEEVLKLLVGSRIR